MFIIDLIKKDKNLYYICYIVSVIEIYVHRFVNTFSDFFFFWYIEICFLNQK